MELSYDVIVVGAGHAGIEASMAAAKLGHRTVCLTLNLDSVGFMPCNPSIGGPAKGHLVREIDALGGWMGLAADHSLIQLKMLNTSKGPAVRALRAQVDKYGYHRYMLNLLGGEMNLELRQLTVEEILFDGNRVTGVRCRGGVEIHGRAVVVTTGTYLSSCVFMGADHHDGGPNGQMMSSSLSQQFRDMGLELVRLKTGTPPRVDGKTIGFSLTAEQKGDDLPYGFSFMRKAVKPLQSSCWLTYTNPDTHSIIKENLDVSPLYTGAITGKGPRYCPSIESKVMNFPDKDRHQIFLEPEGKDSFEYYVGGFSTSLPAHIQDCLLRTIPGMGDVRVLRYGYAIEYDSIRPWQLTRWLQVKEYEGLYTAGQINGTSGYEEAAAQGLMAGINASRYINNQPPFILGRDEAYIGVLIDDLVTKDLDEPYRMLTTRAEFRMLLREGNADRRLTPKGRELGLVDDARFRLLNEKLELVNQVLDELAKTTITWNDGGKEVRTKALAILRRPHTRLDEVYGVAEDERLTPDAVGEIETMAKYEGYIEKQLDQVQRLQRNENRAIGDIDFSDVPGLSTEGREKLSRHKPDTLGQAGRISGVGATDLNALLLHLIKKDRIGGDTIG